MFAKRITMMMSAVSLALVCSLAAPAGANVVGSDQGCTPGYWKNHTASWEEYTPTTPLWALFTFPAPVAGFKNETMLVALDGGGGPGVTGATTILMRAAVAAILNAADDSVGYPLRRTIPSPFEPWASDARFANGIKGAVNDALASNDRATILALATTLDNANNLGCPLS